ncbi:Psilocybin cluster transcription regulator [Mycena venus]|uniref:Psilocybin cluster transcription regulator n=1 Tax=Mycena venus TaxID=2733690 RepID=A0A8H6Z5V5_9AGAR|nr:Psilocybin cluster transcription regulator [Mycena venus]
MASGASDSTLSSAPAPAGPAPMNLAGLDLAQLQANSLQAMPGLDPAQLMNILRTLPGVFTKQLADGTLKDDAAQVLSSLSHLAQGGTGPGGFRVSDPGPSSHPHGPPTLTHVAGGVLPPLGAGGMPPAAPAGAEDGDDGDDGEYADKPEDPPARKPAGGGKGRGRGGATMGSEEWTRQRKDNHKEVERRRRGNINEGINELGRIVPSGSGEKAKGAILSRAVQYIHHLKENEARNIEKWTLEKLLMDQAMGDLQVQLDEIRRMWEEERMQRQRAEQELEALRGNKGASGAAEKRASPEGGEAEGSDGKRQRTE